MTTIGELGKKYHARIAPLDLELLFSLVLRKPREFVMIHPEYKLNEKQKAKIIKLIRRRISGEPLAYILGQKEFYGLDFIVNKNTLIPRPETELLVEKGLEELRNKLRKVSVVDIGTGSGNIIVSIASQLKNHGSRIANHSFWGFDISRKALAVAKQNAKKNKLDKKIKFSKGDLLSPLLKSRKSWIHNSYLIILANLPYLDTGWKNLLRSTETRGLRFEPETALYAGQDGLDAYRRLAAQLREFPLKNTVLFCEIGHLQKKEMGRIFSFAKDISFHRDLAGKWRVAEIRF